MERGDLVTILLSLKMNSSEGSSELPYFDYWNNETLLLVDLEDVFLNPHLHPVTQVGAPRFFLRI